MKPEQLLKLPDMNHLFQDFSWLQYAALLAFALIIYYVYVGLAWYRTGIVRLFHTDRGHSIGPVTPLVQQTGAEDFGGTAAGVQAQTEKPELSEAELLTTALLAAIAESSGRPYEPAAAVLKLKAIIRRHPQLRNSPHSGAINSLVVVECKKTGIAQLSEEEVNQWWWQQ